MTHWQILRASKASLLAPGYPLHHGHRVAVHYSTAAEALDGSAASTDKLTMQELNSRLALYLQQVHCLEAANQQLEYQILQQLDKKCPGDLQHLDGHLQMVSLLRDQISEQLSIQGQMKLQLLTAELVACNFKIRFEKEQEYRGGVEAELKYLKLLGEELMMHKLPELQKLLNSQTQQMMQMQIQHQQNVQGLLAQVSGGITVDMQVVKSADLKLQLNHQKHNVTLFNHDDCFTNQETTATFQRPAVSEAAVVGLNQLRGTAASMEQELMLLQSQNMQLECFGQQQMESSVEQLEFLQQREDGLCRDLDSALQTVTQQAANYQDLLDIKNQLENEIQNYRHLLDEQGCQWLPKNSFCAPFNTAAFRNKIIQENMVSFQGGNLNMGAVQTKGYTGTVQQTPVFTPLSETVATVQSIRVQDNSPLTSIYTSDLTDLFHKTENQRTEALFERSERESTMINRWSNLIDYKDHTIDPESFSLKQTNIDVGFKAGTSTDNITGADIKQETHFITHTATADPCTQPLAEVVKETETAELKSYVHTFDQDSAQVASLKLEPQAEMIKDAVEVAVTTFEVSSLPTTSSCSATSNEILVSESLTASADTLRKSMTMNRWSCLLEDKVQAVDPDPLNQSVVGAQISLGVEDRSITSLKSEPQAEMIKDASEVVVTAFEVSSLPTASSCSATSNEILVSESLTASADTLRKSMTMNRWSCLLEDKVQAVEPDLLNQSVVGAQISLGVEDRSVPSLKLEPQAEVVRDASEVVVVTAFEVSGSEGVQGEVSSGVMLMDGKNSVKEVADVVLDLPTASLCIANSKDILVKDDITVQSTETLKEVNGFHVTDGVKVASQTDCGVILSSGYAKEPLSITVPVTCPTETSDAEMCQSPNDCLSLIGEEDDEIALDLTEASACVRPVEKYVLSTQGESRSVSFSVDQNVLKVDRNRNAYSLVDNKAGDSFGSVPSAGTVGVATGPAATSEAQDLIRVPSKESEESPPVATFPASSQPETGRFGKSGQWMVYGGSIGRKSSQDGNVSLPNTESEDSTSVATQLAANPPGTGRFGSTGSGEWRVYGGSTGSFSSGGSTERVRVSTSSYKMSSVPGDKMSEGRLSSSGSVLRRSSSLGSTEKLSSAGSGGKLSSSSGNLISSSGIVSVTGSGHRSSMGSVGRPGRGKTTTRHRTHSPGERRSVSGGSGGWLSGSAAGGNRISSSVSAPKLSSSGSSERINSRGGGRGKGSPRLGRANIAGGRVITSSDGPVRSTGSGTGTNQERISVCKMAALTMSAAGRERSQERHRQAQRSAQQEASASPLIQRWLTSAVDVPMADPDGLDDII